MLKSKAPDKPIQGLLSNQTICTFPLSEYYSTTTSCEFSKVRIIDLHVHQSNAAQYVALRMAIFNLMCFLGGLDQAKIALKLCNAHLQAWLSSPEYIAQQNVKKVLDPIHSELHPATFDLWVAGPLEPSYC